MGLKLLAFISILLIFQPAYSQDVDEVFKKLVSADTVKCSFSQGVIADYKSGDVKIGDNKMDDPIVFTSIDLKKGEARMIGNLGSAPIIVMPTVQGLTFIERTEGDSLNFTTVFFFYKKNTKNFCAVMSRHISTLGDPMPSQLYGTCQVW